MPAQVATPYDHLVVFVLALLAAVVAVVVLLLLQRVVAGWRLRRERRREAALAPLVHGALEDRAATTALAAAMRRRDRPIVRQVLLSLVGDLRGDEARALGTLYRDLGFLAEDLRRMRGAGRRGRIRALGHVGALRSPEALPAVVRALDDHRVEIRLAAVQALGAIGGATGLGVLVSLLGDPSARVARRAATFLADQGRDVAAEITRYAAAQGGRGRRAALELIERLRLAEAVDLLVLLMDDADDEVRIGAVKAAAAIGDPRCRDGFRARLGDPRWEARAQAARGLGLLGDPASVLALEAALADPAWWVRYRAGEGLAECGAAGAAALWSAAAADGAAGDMARYHLARAADVTAA